MAYKTNPARRQSPDPDSILFVSGYGIDMRVKRGRLRIEDGIANDRRVTELSRADRDISRILIHGHTGSVTLDAFRWMNDCDISFVHIDSEGTLLAASVPQALNRPRVMRAQVLAMENGIALDIMRDVFSQKLRGQIEVLTDFGLGATTVPIIRSQSKLLDRSRTLEDMAGVEAYASAAYWKAWEGTGITFGKGERVPSHWRIFRGRRMGIRSRNYNSTDPLNAILNYLYAIMEAEGSLACHSVGLEPRVGWMHADRRWRPSLALDLMEAVRHHIDRWALAFLGSEKLTHEDFFEQRNGVCRILPPMGQILSETSGTWRDILQPLMRSVAARIDSVDPTGRRDGRRPGYSGAQRRPVPRYRRMVAEGGPET